MTLPSARDGDPSALQAPEQNRAETGEIMTLEDDVATAIASDPDAQDALRAIVRVVIRQLALRTAAEPVEDDILTIGPLQIDRLRRIVTVEGAEHVLKPREYALLETLAKRPGVVFTRSRLLDVAWPEPEAIDDERTIDVHVRRLRSKLGAALNIRTVSGTGYALYPPDKKRKT